MLRISPLFGLVLLLVSIPAALTQAAPAPTALMAPPADPITLDQLRRFEEVASITEATRGLLQRGLVQQKTQLPPWWPETVWNEMTEKVLSVDKAAIDLPFYQQCYSRQDARFFIHLFETPGGHAYARKMVGLEAEKVGQGSSVSDARSSAMANETGLNPSLIKTLDQEDQKYAGVIFGTHRGADISACVGASSPEALKIFQAQQIAAVQSVVAAHSAELGAAQAKYNSDHPEKKAP